MDASRKLPGDITLEHKIIATLCDEVRDHYNIITKCGLTAKSFSDFNSRRVMVAAKSLHDKGMKIDLMSLVTELNNDIDLMMFLTSLQAQIASTANLDQWCKIQKKHEIARDTLRLLKGLEDDIYSGKSPIKALTNITDKAHELQKSVSLGGLSADMAKKYNESFFDYHEAIEEPEYIFSLEVEGTMYGQACLGDLVVVGGQAKTKKTTFLRGNMISAITNDMYMGWSLKLSDNGMLGYVDTEQPKHRFQRTQKKIYDQSNITDPTNYKALSLRRFSKPDRLILIEKMLIDNPNIEILVIDGIVDLIEDFNDNKSSGKIVDDIMRLTEEYQCMIITVLHTNPGSNKLRGHAGTIIVQKADCVILCSVDEKDREENGNNAATKVSIQAARDIEAPAHE